VMGAIREQSCPAGQQITDVNEVLSTAVHVVVSKGQQKSEGNALPHAPKVASPPQTAGSRSERRSAGSARELDGSISKRTM